jgi:glycosyltransferase involved in cell wall biosynthesis
MKLAIIYHVYKNSATLQKSFESIFNQTDKNFEFICINDGASSKISKILSDFDFSSLKNFTYFKYSQNLGHAYSFNQALKSLNSDYILFVGSNFIPDKNFIETVNNIIKINPNVDVISFNNRKNNKSYQTFTKLNSKMKLMLGQSMKDKIFSTKLLHEHNLLLNEQIYAPLLFIYQVLTQFKK